MIIRVDAAGEIRVDEHDVFTDFHVEDSAGFSTADLAATMGEDTRADGEYLWIAETAVRRWLSGRIDETWDEGFSGMFQAPNMTGVFVADLTVLHNPH